MKKTVLFLGVFLLLTQCKVNQFTGKKTLQIYGNKTVLPQAFKAYDDFITTNKVIRNTTASNQIQHVGKKITRAAEAYFEYKQNLSYLDDYAWEYNLVEDKAINAWFMPGGKIVFYTGIMDVAETEAGIAAIMGHEVAHALANHGAQRMSAGTIQQGLGILGAKLLENEPEKKRDLFLKAYGIGSNEAEILPFSRGHENEADIIGMQLMAIAGYDPAEAASLWERMKAQSPGSKTPQILSTHPSHQARISNLRKNAPQALVQAQQIKDSLNQ